MRDGPDSLMLFAAGFGTRMAPLTDDRPKPLIEVAGRPLIDHAAALARAAGVRRVVANLHYRADMLAEHLAGSEVATITEIPEILDTGGGLKHALPHLGGEAVFTLNTDAVWTGANPLDTLRAAWDPARMDALLCLVPVARATGHGGTGDFAMAEGGRLRRGAGFVYSGAQILRAEPVAAHPGRVFSLNEVWDAIARDGRLFGVLHPGGWCDVGRPESIPLAEALLREADGA